MDSIVLESERQLRASVAEARLVIVREHVAEAIALAQQHPIFSRAADPFHRRFIRAHGSYLSS